MQFYIMFSNIGSHTRIFIYAITGSHTKIVITICNSLRLSKIQIKLSNKQNYNLHINGTANIIVAYIYLHEAKC